jgi:phosphoglycerate dehydrogenase-like enzyme
MKYQNIVRAGLIGVMVCGAADFVSAAWRQPASTSQAQPEPIGSTRNARVAFPMPADKKIELTFLAGNVTAEQLAELKKVAPNVRVITGMTRQTAMEHAAEANGVDVRFATPEFIAKAPKLVWVQATSAGVDRFLTNKPLVETDRIVLTNMKAVHGPAIADHAMAMLLELTRGLRFYDEAQKKGKWADESPTPRPVALQGKTMLVVGIGGIGTEIAQRAHGFGMRVIATRRTDAPAPAYVERVGKPEDLVKMLPEADVVAVCVPLTAETEKLFNAAAFEAMKKGSFLINIARGRVVETGALVEALKSGQLAGACLDVTEPEPLPEGHPLWGMKNVVITPHTAADAELTEERHWALFKENVRRFGAGEPLLNCVDKKAGY